MLDIDDITHVDSVIAREFPLHNCGSWNRIKKELVVVQIQAMPELLAKWPVERMGQKSLLEAISALHGLIDRFVAALKKKVV